MGVVIATYSTDLTTLTTAEAGTWTEFASPYNGGGSPAANAENFIQGTGCYSQTTGKAVGLEISIVFDYGSGYTFATDEAVFAWGYYAIGTNIETSANSGWRFGIGSSTSAWDWFKVGGSDYGRNPYGGWTNFAIDPTATETGTIGGGNGGTYRYFGSIPYTLAEISKGEPSAMDAIRAGRGEISVTGTGGTFTELSSYNDWNSTATPPGTSSTVLDSGYHRLGLFQDNGGTFLWKGLMSLGLSATSATFTDSNQTILIEDTANTYALFNKIEVNHASSVITLTNITFIPLGTVSKGSFEMIADATVDLTGCSFNSMNTFIFDSNATVDACVFNTCALITSGGGTFTDCVFNEPTGVVGVTTASPAEAALISNSEFVSDGTGNGLEITGTAANMTLTGVDFTGYSTTVDADKAIYVNIASGTMTLSISGGSGVTADSHVRTAGATVTVVADPVSTTVTALTTAGVEVQSARVILETKDGTGPLPFEDSVSITQTGGTATVTHTAHGLSTGHYIVIRGTTQEEYNKVASITVTTVNAYTYAVDSGATSPATGSPVASAVICYGLTDVNGEVTDSRTFSADQPVKGRILKSTLTPLYRTAPVTGTIDSANGVSLTGVMILDE